MPFQLLDATTENGLRYLRIEVSGQVTLADGHNLEARLLSGAPVHRGYALSVVAKSTVYSPDVRKFFPSLDDKITSIAAVVTSPIVRAAINMMMRIARRKSILRMFTSEAEALAWLEEQASIHKDVRSR